jgi:branched-subunit amino acid transport protein
MSGATWATVGGLAVATAAVKGSGPVIFGGRRLPPAIARVIPLLPGALLAALVVIETIGGTGESLKIDDRLWGLGAAAAAIALGRSMPVIVVAAAASTALARAIGI